MDIFDPDIADLFFDDDGDQVEIPQLFGPDDHERFMLAALQEAVAAAEIDEVPIGAVIAHEGKIIARAHNQRETLKDPTAHAEMIALTQAAEYLGTWRLTGCTIYVTLEPCPMCAGALVNARIDRLVYGPPEPKSGACGSLFNIVQDERLNHRLEVISDFMSEPSVQLLQDFFARKRSQGKK
ncbi:MAG: nucleoside deaminase [Phycisphaerae bacterium]|nr:nucleoside deaminase [Phycisphaerae bacterium]